MPSFPPTPRSSRPPLPRLCEASFRATAVDETVVFVCVEGAPLAACRTRTGADGSLTFDTELSGRVLAVAPEELRIVTGGGSLVTVRHLLPSSIELAGLVGQEIGLHVTQRYSGPGRATVDAELRDASGRLLLWAHDGRLPADRASHGLALRCTVAVDPGEPSATSERSGGSCRHRLAVSHGGGVACVGAPDLCRVWIGADAFDLALVRVRADDVSFVLLRA